MKNLKLMFFLCSLLICCNLNAQSCDNVCMDFDGAQDIISLSPVPLTPNSDFSVEMWFNSDATTTSTNCGGGFKRLFVLSGGATRFEIGECGGILNIFVQNNSGSVVLFPTVLYGPSIRTGGINAQNWHHIAVTRAGNSISVYLNGANVSTLAINGSLNPTTFQLGHYLGGLTPGQDWEGQIDDIRLWDYSLSATEIDDRKNCVLAGNETGLLLNWQFDEGLPGLNNTAITQVTDATGLGNAGTFSTNFTLNGAVSNYAPSTAGLVYPNYNHLGLQISDYPYKTAPLSEICNGEPAHFCLDKSGVTPPPNPNVIVQWEHSDDAGATWVNDPNPPFNDFCFAMPTGNLITVCAGSAEGFVDRQYRAKSQVHSPILNETCDYYSQVEDLRICCPISPATITIQPNAPLCENETLTVNISLNSPDLFVNTPGSMTTIDWFYDDGTGSINIGNTNQTSFAYTLTTPNIPTPGTPLQVCFKAVINHCTKSATISECLTVDPEPQCGNIIGLPTPNTLTLATTTPHTTYQICPGNDAALGIDPANPFSDCIPEWQYSFDCLTWSSMGYSNTQQNTNILPTIQPPVPWPAGTSSIFYRIKCNPLSSPSGCDPCYSDKIEVMLTPDPIVSTITGATMICKEDLPTPLSIVSPNPAHTYTWYCDGLAVGTGTTYNATEQACYYVETSNGCITTKSAFHCLTVCEVIPIISCPQSPNECAEEGVDIKLSAMGSYITCDPNSTSLQYSWTIDTDPSIIGDTITHKPKDAGSNYVLTVTDPNTGCSATTSRFVKPCDFED